MAQNRNSKKLEWASTIERWKLSGKKAQAWCRENHVVYHTFLWWRNRLGYSKPKKPQPLPAQTQFIELQDQPKCKSEISLEYEGVIIHLKDDFDPSLLKKCLVVLRGALC